jgi:regulator of sigma E protease
VVYLISGINQVRPVLGSIEPTSPIGRTGFKAGDEIVAIDARTVSSQEDILLDLLDAVSGNAPITLSARVADGSIRTAQLDIPPGAARVRLTEPEAMIPSLGLQFFEPPPGPALLSGVQSNGPAAHAGLAPGDLILAVNDSPVQNFQELETQVRSHPAENLLIRYRRDGSETSVRVKSLSVTDNGRTIGRIGIEGQRSGPPPANLFRHVNLSLGAAFVHANVEAWDMTALQGRLFWRMLVCQVSVKNLSGPLSIAQYAGDSAVLGYLSFLRFLVIVSLALGFMNLLPIPILDGGQIVFQTIEWLKGSPLSERFQIIGQQLGMALLVLLMSVALFNDISRQFG